LFVARGETVRCTRCELFVHEVVKVFFAFWTAEFSDWCVVKRVVKAVV
jgi:hypothetical protein